MRADSPPITNNVYTTNYDPVYESALKLNDINYCDGFIQHHSELVFGNEWYNNMVQLAKLHGSIDYYLRQRDDMVVKHSLPADENGTDISGDKLQRMMILPIGEKYVTRTPYLEFLQKLREDLQKEEIVIVIGFKFRDDPITNAFIDSVSRRRRIKMIVVAPEAKDIISNNHDDERTYYRCWVCNEMFAKTGVIAVMKLHLDKHRVQGFNTSVGG